MADYVVASDLGTGSCKTVVLNHLGTVVGSAHSEYPSFYPRPGWVEQNPKDWLRAVGETVRSAITQSGVAASQIAAFGIVGVTHNAVLLDEAWQPLRPCILYLDSRARQECDDLQAQWKGEIFRRTWNSISPIWTWPQLLWIKYNEPKIWKATRKILFQKDYVRHCLAPSPVTDLIDAEGSLLYDPIADCWVEEFVYDLGLDKTVYPEVFKPTDIVSKIDRNGAALTGLLEGTPVIAGTTDTAAEVLGAGALKPNQGTLKLASVGRITTVTTHPINHQHSLNYRHVIEGLWYPGTSTKYASAAFRWLRDAVWDGAAFDRMGTAAETVPPGSNGVLFHPHLQGEWVPYWDEQLRGDFIGLSISHSRSHLTRAVMEGVAFALRAGLEFAQSLGLAPDEMRLIGRGSISSLWAQIIADTLNCPLTIPVERDAAYGIALITGMGIGMFPQDGAGIDNLIRVEEQVTPKDVHASLYDELFQIYQESDKALHAYSRQLTRFEKKHSWK